MPVASASFVLFVHLFLSVSADYWSDRAAFIKLEQSQAIGSSIELSEEEEAANKILMNYKLQEYDRGFSDPGSFAPAQHFFHAREDIEKSEVFKLIRKLPKGASLHAHDTALVSGDYVFNLTYHEHLYGCLVNSRLRLRFFNGTNVDDTCNWDTLRNWRERVDTFDEFLKTQLSIIVDDPKNTYTDLNAVWEAFINTFMTVEPVIMYKPVFKEYFYRALYELYEDNVKYMEFRGTLPSVYDLDGTEYGPVEVVRMYKETLEEFMKDFPDFQGARFIYAPIRFVDNATVHNYSQIAKELKVAFPDFVAGFDLVGQEDLGKPLVDFIDELQEMRDEYDIKFYFHAGETNWYGSSTDLNLVDAVLLKTVRIGHGYALSKHPEVLKVIKEQNTAVEVCPVSNQVLKLVDDVRNHPAATLIAQGYPITICNDDPSFWGAKGLSYDWYLAFMGIASREMGLRFLKQLALNSLLHSSMSDSEKKAAIEDWNYDWNKFIQQVVNQTNDVEYQVFRNK